MKFSPEYVRLVLDENFEDAKAQFLAPLMAIHYAHLVMLVERGIVAPDEARAIRTALDRVDLDAIRAVRYDGTYEDLFFYVDRLIAEGCGEDAAGRLHTARSRNDIDMTMYRMRQRELVLAIVEAALQLRRVLLALADRYREAVFAAHTHTQPAQPSTIAHYLLAVVEQVERDTVRLKAAYASTNRNPLGACAITGTGFPIDRGRTAELLGFDGTTGNTYGSIATVDYLLESASASAILLVGLGRVVQDLLLWCTSEFGYLRLADGFVQCSSIMPQKRNPVALEHARAIGSKALAQANGLMLAVHNTPFGDIVDTEDDLQPLVGQAFRDAARAIALVAAAMEDATFDVARLAERAAAGWVTVTELADTLSRDHGLSFKAGHSIASRLIAASRTSPATPIAALLREVSSEITGRPIVYDDRQLAEILSPRHFVAVRTTYGGPAPSETARASGVSTQSLSADQEWLAGTRAKLTRAAEKLKDAAKSL
ncbi:MAG TPA: argininosuccinate lyase [Vicinamibacterales bacterium]|nr:argininosuccinate lyase [Vicinamibacterales bacterium]